MGIPPAPRGRHALKPHGPKRIDTSGGGGLAADNPFAALDGSGLPPAPASPPAGTPAARANGPVLRVRRLTQGCGGRAVVEIAGFTSDASADEVRRNLQRLLATGGTQADRVVEIQGEHLDAVLRHLAAAGFRPVKSGG